MQQRLAKQTIALLGVGHTNAHVLKMWRMQPIPDTQLICVSNHPIATYSGMMPGVLAGDYKSEQMEIDLVRLCSANGARLILDEVTGVDAERQLLQFAERPALPYDALSIGIGSVPARGKVDIAEGAEPLAIKPMQTFLKRLHKRLKSLTKSVTDRPLKIAVVGGGAGGVEIAFCLPPRIRHDFPDTPFEIHLIHGSKQILPGHRDSTAKRATDQLRAADTRLHLGHRVVKIEAGTVVLDDAARGDRLEVDLVLWSTSATAPPLLETLSLRRDNRDFLLTNKKLQSVSNPRIFAVGDSGTIEGVERPKSGVFAVRQGPILWQNLARVLRGRPLLNFTPQRDFLKLINTGNGRAISEYRGRTREGRWMWRWKDRIDRKFMAMYQQYDPPMMQASAAPSPEDAEDAMRCLGCGGKVGGGVLRRALAKLDVPQRDEVKIGLDDPDVQPFCSLLRAGRSW